MGHTTIVCSWTLAALACVGMYLVHRAHRSNNNPYGLDDYALIIAFFITTLLVAQTTWAIIDEGQGSHIKDVSPTQLGMVARASICFMNVNES